MNQLWLAITPLEASEQIAQLLVADFPQMKQTDRKKALQRLKKAQEIKILKEEPRELTPEDMMRLFNG